MQNRMFHLRISKNELEGAELAVLPGDPGRVERIAQSFKNPRFLSQNREFTIWLCESKGGKKIVVCSTGIGGPSSAIAVEELAMCGVKDFLRVGTTGLIQAETDPGTVVIMTGAVRLEGTSRHIAPIEFPAVAHHEWVRALVDAARALKIPHVIGISASSDTFYQGQGRKDSFRKGFVIKEWEGRLQELEKLGVLSFEMEAGLILTQTAAFGLRGASIAVGIVNRHRQEFPDESFIHASEARVIELASQAVDYLDRP